MTVAIGLVCSDGVLVASDSMGSNGPIAEVTKKVRAFGRTPAIWTAAGSVFVVEEVERALRGVDTSGSAEAPLAIFTTPDVDGIRTKLNTAVTGAMRSAYGNALHVAPPDPGRAFEIPFASSFLLLGYSNGTPWFLEIAADGQLNWHTERGFYAVGSGGPFASVAEGLMRHYLERRPTLSIGQMIAYRAIETTVQVSSGGVGLPVQIARCSSAGTHLLTADELDEVATGVARWKTLESESLQSFSEPIESEVLGDLPSLDEDTAA